MLTRRLLLGQMAAAGAMGGLRPSFAARAEQGLRAIAAGRGRAAVAANVVGRTAACEDEEQREPHDSSVSDFTRNDAS